MKKDNNTSEQKRITILLGAGAAIPWGGPLSKDIDKLLSNSNTYKTIDNSQTIGSYIFEVLREYFTLQNEINFETFLFFIESVFNYLKDKTLKGVLSPLFTSINPIVFDLSSCITKMKDPEMLQETINNISNGHSEIEYGSDYEHLAEGLRDFIDKIYFLEMHSYYMKRVIEYIASYSGAVTNDEFSEINGKLTNFISFLQKKNYIVRIYTTNYDNLAPKALLGKNVFDGFIESGRNVSSDRVKFKTKEIHENRDCLNYYNLHGSIYWHMLHNMENGYQFDLKPGQYNPFYDSFSTVRTNPGQEFIPTNIVTGYNKLQRTSMEPYNLFFNSFINDCYSSTKILTVGFSYSDFHINSVIRNALQNFNSELILVTKGKSDEFLGRREWYNLQQTVLGNYSNPKQDPTDLNTMIISENDKKHFIYLDGFDNYLNLSDLNYHLF